MTRFEIAVGCICSFLIAFAIVVVVDPAPFRTTSPHTPTPTQIVDRWVWYVAHDDFWHACQQVHIDAAKKQSALTCAASLAWIVVATGAEPPGVVPHSQRINGDRATVVVTVGEQRVKAKLVRTRNGWRIDGFVA